MSTAAHAADLVQRATDCLKTATRDVVQAMRLMPDNAPASFLSLRALLSSIQVMLCWLVDYCHLLAEPATHTDCAVGGVAHELMLLQDKVIAGQMQSFQRCLDQWAPAGTREWNDRAGAWQVHHGVVGLWHSLLSTGSWRGPRAPCVWLFAEHAQLLSRYAGLSRKIAFATLLPWQVGSDVPAWLERRAFDLFVDTRRRAVHAGSNGMADGAAAGARVACPPGAAWVTRQSVMRQLAHEWRGLRMSETYSFMTQLLTAAPSDGEVGVPPQPAVVGRGRSPLTHQSVFW